MKNKILKRPSSGGESLKKKHGNDYFSKLAKDGWKKRKERQRLYDQQ